jgi:hypothetical protein
MGVSPKGGLALFHSAGGSRNTRFGVVESLLVWDLNADAEVTELPSHDGELGDTEPPWTPDGRYLYYLVEDPGREGPTTWPAGSHGSRIWDRQTGEIVGTVPDTYPVGPGPGDSLMVLEQRNPGRPQVHPARCRHRQTVPAG